MCVHSLDPVDDGVKMVRSLKKNGLVADMSSLNRDWSCLVWGFSSATPHFRGWNSLGRITVGFAPLAASPRLRVFSLADAREESDRSGDISPALGVSEDAE